MDNSQKNSEKKEFLNRKKTDPGKFIYTGAKTKGKLEIQLFSYNNNECIESQDIKYSEIPSIHSLQKMHWLNIFGLDDPDAIAMICQNMGVHNLAIQDILDVNQRPKYQEFETYSLLVIKSIIPESAVMNTEQISFVYGKNYLVSFQEKKTDYFDHLRYRLRENKGIIRKMGSDYLLFTMLEAILDNYFKVLQQYEEEVEHLNLIQINTDISPKMLEKIERRKKYVHKIRKSILPIKEFTLSVERGDNQCIEKSNLKYFFEINDLCLTLLDSCDTIASSLESSTNLYFSIQGHRMNQVMKTLTIVSTIFIPLTFVAGIYGMNFTNMPEIKWKYGYFAIWIVFILIFAGMFYYLKRKKWF